MVSPGAKVQRTPRPWPYQDAGRDRSIVARSWS
jgi:hypothetical protein